MTESTISQIPRVREAPCGAFPAIEHPGWALAFPWLVQGTTVRGDEAMPFDMGLFSGGSPEEAVRRRWGRLLEGTGVERVVHARQEHGREVRVFGSNEAASEKGDVPTLVEPCDGHATDRQGVLLAVGTADCVPISVVDPRRRAVSVLHAGWRGAAAGVLEEGLDRMRTEFGTRPAEVVLHLGPAICGSCYEVGPEVFEALDLNARAAPEPIDLRGALARRAVAAGVAASRLSISTHCTRCTGSGLFSHRGGDRHRQVTFLGRRVSSPTGHDPRES